MISDTLSDAAEEIRDYLSTYPEMYNTLLADIENVLVAMDTLRSRLDALPDDNK